MMIKKERLKLIIQIGIISFALVWMLGTVNAAERSTVSVEAELDSYVQLTVSETPLKFNIDKPIKGVYRENKRGYGTATLQTNCPVEVRFEATELIYQGKEDFTDALNATYWVDKPGNSHYAFRPDSSLALNIDYERDIIRTFNLYGKIELESLSAQPAGTYKGEIIITVTKR